MYSYEEVSEYIQSKACVVMDDGDFPEGAFYQNLNNFEICYALKEEMDEISYLDIIFELEIDPPDGLEESYAEFVEFRKNLPVTKKANGN